ncbi:MAG TPA: ATP-binding cassette domain-containing protein [Patescibacteria group bacterium]|nr:ATP-binding cassette domain-containing protein [Patescibacteria group bacterium]
MSNAFELKNVTKHFDDILALSDVTLAAEEGKVFGLLGPNGAGKTTIVRILSTLLLPDKGTAKIQGIDIAQDPEKARELIGLAGQYAAVDEFLTGYENIYMTGRLYGLGRAESKKRATNLLERFNLTEAGHRPVRTYSGGMRRRLDLGASLIGQPKILFLDEPTSGLDPKTRLDLWDIIRELISNGTTILLTTQYLEEADELADKISVMDNGKIIAHGTSDELKAKMGGDVVEFTLLAASDEQTAIMATQQFAKTKPTFDEQSLMISVPVKNGAKDLMGIVQSLNNAKLQIEELSLHRPSLDDVFLSLTGQKTQPKNTPAKQGRR